jgi:type I restriction enzyme S subunit
MTPAELIAAFDVLADAPDGVKRLRELVLSLAVRGKLVEQDPAEEAAHAYLATLASELQVPATKKGKCLDHPWRALPAGWTVASLSDFGQFFGGKTPSTNTAKYWGGDVPWVSPKDMKSIDIESTEDFVTWDAVEAGLALLPPGSVLVVVRSGILRRTVPVAICRTSCTINQDIRALRPYPSAFPEYLRLIVQGFEPYILKNLTKTGTTVESIKVAEFCSQPYPIPPLAEQHRIVARVDELMALLDQLEAARTARDEVRRAARDAALAALRDAPDAEAVEVAWGRVSDAMDELFVEPEDVEPLRQAVLGLAVRGRLVRQDPGDGSPDQLLRQLREAGWSPPTDMPPDVEQPWKLPSSWRWVPFGTTHFNRDRERVPLSRDERAPRAGEFDYYGASGVIDKINGYLFDGTLLLIGEDGANLVLRSSPIAFIAQGRFWVNNHAHVLDSVDQGSLRYLAIYINAIDLKPYLTGTAQPKLNQKKLNGIPCALPPLPEQHRIVAKVEALMACCDALARRLTLARDLHGHFAAAAVHHFDV